MGAHAGNRPYGNASYDDTFYVLVDTNGRSDGLTTVELNINESTGGDRYIDWGDGTVEIVNTELPSHTYAEHGEYEIFAWGGTTTKLGQRGGAFSTNVGWTETIKTVRCGSEFGFTDMQSAFEDFTGTTLDVSNLNTSNVTRMHYMFNNCSSLTSLDLSNFDTSSVTTMFAMFANCSSLTSLNVNNFDTSSVTNMGYMFFICSSLTSLDVSNFDTSSVTGMVSMFSACSSLTSLDVSSFDTSSVTLMNNMFRNCSSLTSLDLSNFDTSSVTDIGYMFYNCTSLATLDVSSFDTSSVTNMDSTFRICSSLTSLDVTNFDTSSVTDMVSMFSTCTSLTSLDVSSFNTSSVTDMNNMFRSCTSLTTLDVSGFDTSSVTNMLSMFYNCTSFTSLDVSSFNTSSVTDMSYMFYFCQSLTSLDVSSFDTSLVTNMYAMFYNCASLTSLDVTNFDTSSVTDMSFMFGTCSSLTDIVGVEDFNIEGLDTTSDLNGFATEITLPTSRYDALLINWDAQDPLDNLSADFGNSQYTATAARESLIQNDGWTITDGGPSPFELTVETTTANETFLLPMQSVTSIDIDWGDGTVDTGITSDNPTHVYTTAGTHAISVTGTAGTVVFYQSGSQGKLRTVTNLGALGWTTFEASFRQCQGLTSFVAGDCDTSNVTDMQRMFQEIYTTLTFVDVRGFDTSKVTSMYAMFRFSRNLSDIVGVEDFNIEGLIASNSLFIFAAGVTLPTSRYDALLINWDAQDPLDNLSADFGNSTYTAGGVAEAARTSLINGDGWTITDGGAAP